MGPSISRNNVLATAALVCGAVVFLYFNTLAKLTLDWWSDENYSHGLLVPFIIGLIIFREWDRLKAAVRPAPGTGGIFMSTAVIFLAAGILAAELFAQRVSFVIMLAGLVIYFFGWTVLRLAAVPFALFILAIPIPQILFNRFAFPLQIFASQMAVWGIRLFEVPTVRNGNVIDILPKGSTQPISLEVVEACSGIRSLMTLVTLALILGYFTRRSNTDSAVTFSTRDLARTLLLMGMAVPIAVFTNAARVTATALMTYWVGKQATASGVHDASGFLVFIGALGLLFGTNLILRRMFHSGAEGLE
jgi:exosortase